MSDSVLLNCSLDFDLGNVGCVSTETYCSLNLCNEHVFNGVSRMDFERQVSRLLAYSLTIEDLVLEYVIPKKATLAGGK